MNLNELKYKAAQVSDDMFGRNRPAIGPIKKLKDEVDELLECFEEDEDPSEEFADCFLILIDAYRKHYGDDVDMQKLIDDSSDKLDVVMNRIYKETDVEGVFQHVKDPVDEELPWEREDSVDADLKLLDEIIRTDGWDMDKIQKVYDELSLKFAFELVDTDTMNKIKKELEDRFPGYTIKCDDENNPWETRAEGQIWVRVSMKTRINSITNYVDLVF